jgi:hypothetical protein
MAMRVRTLLLLPAAIVALASCAPSASIPPRTVPDPRAEAVAAFATVQKVLQHPRCQNCHIPGDAPLQFDAGLPHMMAVVRGEDGFGAAGLPCSTCHDVVNPPASFGPHAPPGAPAWRLPSPDRKMVFINLSPAKLCATIKNRETNGGRDFDALIKHVAEDELVLALGVEPRRRARAGVGAARGVRREVQAVGGSRRTVSWRADRRRPVRRRPRRCLRL